MIQYYGYDKCGTCRKAKKFFEENKVNLKEFDITQTPPSLSQLKKLYKLSGLPIKRFLNTSGEVYREMKLKDKLPNLSDGEVLKLLSENGKLIKRPIVFDDKKVTVGFKEDVFDEIWR